MTNNWKVGVAKIPLHLFGFGVPFGLLCWFGGWGTAATLVAWRLYAEFEDWKGGQDTLAKALIDFGSQTILCTFIAILKYTI